MDTNDSDNIFREKLGNYAAEPDPHVWDRIRHSLDKKQRKRLVPLWFPLGAAVAVVLLALWFTGPFSDPNPGNLPVSGTEKAPSEAPSGKSRALDSRPESEVSGATGTGVAETATDASPATSPTSSAAANRPQASGEIAGSPKTEDHLHAAQNKNGAGNKKGLSGTAPSDFKESGSEVAENAPGKAANTLVPNPSESNQALVTSGKTAPPGATETGLTQADAAAEAEESGKKSLFDAIKEQEAEPVVASETGKWSMGPSVAPVYYNSFGNGSPIASTFMENSKSGTVNLSYGLSVAYEVSNRLSLRSGIHKVDFGYNTNQVSFTSTVAVRPSSLIRTISYSENSKNVVVHSTLNPTGPAQQEGAALDITAPSPQREGRMLQQFGYLEVPIELQYALIDRQWGLNLIGGMSSLFLIDNSVSLDSNGTSTEIGEASNMNALNFSTNLGLGVYYQLNPRWQLQLQPMVKMHLNTFNETAGSFRPYTVGVYSGMSFRF